MTFLTGVTASSSGDYSGAFAASFAFDGVTGLLNDGHTWSAVGATGWLQGQVSTAQVITGYGIAAPGDYLDRLANTWTFLGSNDGTSWTTLDTQTAQTFTGHQVKSFTFTNTTAYSYYRINVTANGGGVTLIISELILGTASGATTYSAAVFTDSPWGFWEQFETAGPTLRDSTTGTRGLIISGSAATLNQAGPFAGEAAISWANATGCAYTMETVNTSDATVEAWVYLPSTPAANTQIIGLTTRIGDATHDKDLFVDSAGKANFVYYNGAGITLTASAALTLNAWHHIVGSVGAAGGKLRVDKVIVATNAATTSFTGGAQAVVIRGGGTGYSVQTGTDAMRVAAGVFYTTQLTDARTDAHYDAGMTVGTPTTTGAAPVSVGSSSASSLVGGILTTTGASPVNVGSPSVASLLATTAGLSPIGVGSTSAASMPGVTVTVTTGLAPVSVGSSSAVSLSIPLRGWTADLSQQSFLEIVGDTGDLDYTPPAVIGSGVDLLPPMGTLALPPVGLVERTIMRHSITVPAMTPSIDHRVRVSDAVYDAYARTTAVVGIPHVLIGGVDVTYLRGAPTTIGTDRQEGPFGDVTFSIDMPQITPQDTPGVGSLSWLKPGATVELIIRNGSAIKRLWAGHLVSDDGGNDANAPRTAWSASGTMWQASTFIHRVPTIMAPTDIGTVIARSLNGVVAHRYPTIKAPKTSINTMARGSSGDSEMAYVQSLLATAWTSTAQWTVAKRANTARTYDIRLKDVTTVHHTVTVGDFGVDINISRDMTSTANALFGRGIAPNGYAWAGWTYPNFMADTAPAYPYASGATVMTVGSTDAGTLTGDGVSAWQRRINDLNLTGNVPLDGVFNASDASVCRQIQSDYGLTVDGVVGPQTWDATFAVGSSGGDLSGAYRRPLAIATETEPNLYTPTGAIKGPNIAYTGAMRYERDTDYGPGVTKADATASAKLELARDKTPGLTGTITLLTDPREGSRFFITPGQNIRILGYGGATKLLHIAAVDRDWVNLSVTLTVDEHARDAITLAAIRTRNKEAMIDPARRPGRTNRRSRQAQDQIVPFDGESDGGIIPRHAIYGGLWTVIHIPVSEAGQVAKLDVRSESPKAKFCMAFFAGPVTPAHLVNLVGDPLSGTNPFGRTEAKADALDNLGLIEALGGPGSAAGYWPGSEGTDPLTGRLKDTGGFGYNSVKGGWVWVAEWSPVSTFISGRIYPAPVQ